MIMDNVKSKLKTAHRNAEMEIFSIFAVSNKYTKSFQGSFVLQRGHFYVHSSFRNKIQSVSPLGCVAMTHPCFSYRH